MKTYFKLQVDTYEPMQNFSLFSGFTLDVSNKVVSFCVPNEDESPTVYRLRVPSDADAVNWYNAVQKALNDLLPSHET